MPWLNYLRNQHYEYKPRNNRVYFIPYTSLKLSYQVQLCSNPQMLKGLTALPIGKASNVEIVQMSFLDGFNFSCSHNSNGL